VKQHSVWHDLGLVSASRSEGRPELKTAEDWLSFGIENSWCSKVFCNTHDGGPMTDEEEKEWNDGEDPCQFMVRIDEWE